MCEIHKTTRTYLRFAIAAADSPFGDGVTVGGESKVSGGERLHERGEGSRSLCFLAVGGYLDYRALR